MESSIKILKKIILVDDDEDLLFIFNFWLLKKGFLTIALTDDSTLPSFIESFNPDLILIDINLKNKDGKQVCQYIKKDLRFKKPVLLFSMHDYSDVDYRPFYADGFFQKSSDHLAMIHYISQYI